MSIYIERDAAPGSGFPDALHLASGLIRWLTREYTEALEPLLPDPSLPEGVHRAPDGRMWLAPEAELPEGWEWQTGGGWKDRLELVSSRSWAWQVRPAAPKTERVPWHEAVGRTWVPQSGTAGHGMPVPTTPHLVCEVRQTVRGTVLLDLGGIQVQVLPSADGMVEVLKDPS